MVTVLQVWRNQPVARGKGQSVLVEEVRGLRLHSHFRRARPGTQVSKAFLLPWVRIKDTDLSKSHLKWASRQVTPASVFLISPNQFAKLPLILSGNLQAV